MTAAPAAAEPTSFSTRVLPWMKIGSVIEQPVPPAEALRLAGLDWGVRLVPLRAQVGPNKHVKVEHRVGVARTSDDAILGVVSPTYQPFDNADAFDFFTPLTDEGAAIVHAAGALRGGRTIFMVARQPEGFDVLDGDQHDMYWLLRTSHDGTKAVEVALAPIRISCMNAVGLPSFGRTGAVQRWAVQHTTTMQAKLAEARTVLERTDEYVTDFKSVAERLAAVDLEVDAFRRDLELVLPNRPRRPEAIDAMTRLFTESPTNGYARTGWGALNAVTEYFDWEKTTRSEASRLHSQVDGPAAKTRARLAAVLLAQ